MDQNQNQESEQKQMNGSAGKGHNNHNNNHANGKCTEENKKPLANGNGVHAASSEDSNSMAVEDATLLPHLESIERLMKLPVVEATWHQGQDVYGKVKGNLQLHSHSQLTDDDRRLCAAVFRVSTRNYQFASK